MKVRITIAYIAHEGRNIAEIQTLTVGKKQDMGCTLYGVKSSRIAIAPPKYDKWGDLGTIGDDFVKQYTGQMRFDTDDIDYIDYVVDMLFNRPTVFLLTDGKHVAFNTYGLMTSGEVDLDNAAKSGLPLKIKSFKYKRNKKEC